MSKFYDIGDWPVMPDWQQLKLDKLPVNERITAKHRIKAVATGEFRCPQKGEWFLSGAIVHAYRWAGTPGATPYHIARLVLTKTITTVIEV